MLYSFYFWWKDRVVFCLFQDLEVISPRWCDPDIVISIWKVSSVFPTLLTISEIEDFHSVQLILFLDIDFEMENGLLSISDGELPDQEEEEGQLDESLSDIRYL